jgi:hypothetical protein
MMIKSFAPVLAASILLLAGCSKSSHVATANAPAAVIDWGVVELSANTPKHLSLGEGKDCTVTATAFSSGDLQITIETREKLVGMELPPGVPAGTSVESTRTQTMTVPAGVEILVSVGQQPIRLKAIFKA